MQRKQFLRHVGALIGGAALAPLITACGGGGGSDADTATPTAVTDTSTAAAPTATQSSSVGVLSAAEIAGLKFMREEEKLAHDVYIAMFALWGHQTFANIAESETTHTEAILALLTKYGVDDPAAGKAAGVFEDPELQALYDTLVAAGSANLIEGLKVGALIEETDIEDIEERKEVTDESDILRVYDSLLCGSRNHLRAFNGALLDQGVTYVAQVISQEEWDAIAYSARETCGG
ncbi:DUF2202 domain-containing protein [uncultured Piscinibacter sp.]|uniref:DUF2202 domain-containing protein n=1 Tax=uncultured Piscinibacter sp. TaxID=1131835 RepID=UPI00261EFA83|nr:DUF2202 domain-containing protein [uncultured Piscinibacter sp.]